MPLTKNLEAEKSFKVVFGKHTLRTKGSIFIMINNLNLATKI